MENASAVSLFKNHFFALFSLGGGVASFSGRGVSPSKTASRKPCICFRHQNKINSAIIHYLLTIVKKKKRKEKKKVVTMVELTCTCEYCNNPAFIMVYRLRCSSPVTCWKTKSLRVYLPHFFSLSLRLSPSLSLSLSLPLSFSLPPSLPPPLSLSPLSPSLSLSLCLSPSLSLSLPLSPPPLSLSVFFSTQIESLYWTTYMSRGFPHIFLSYNRTIKFIYNYWFIISCSVVPSCSMM